MSALRRSARIKTAAPGLATPPATSSATSPAASAATSPFANDDTGEDRPEKPVQKRKRVAAPIEAGEKPTRRATHRRGKLADLPNMPLDVLYEIFSKLHPLCLLRLSRITKAFREILMARSARWIWVSALAAVPGLPECPSDMSIPAYVRLAFEYTCSFCSVPIQRKALWNVHVRSCKRCFLETDNFPDIQYSYDSSTNVHFRSNLPTVSAYGIDRRRRHELCALASDVQELQDALKAVSTDRAAILAFLQERKAALVERLKHARRCEEWEMDVLSKRQDQRQQLFDEREAGIFQNLKNLGWERDLQRMKTDSSDLIAAFFKHKYVRQAKALTPRVWANIEATLISLMDAIKAERVEIRRQDTQNARVVLLRKLVADYDNALPFGQAKPPVANIAGMTPFKAVMDTPLVDDWDDTVTPDSFKDAFAELAALSDAWRESSLQTLRMLLPSAGRKALGIEPLDLATSLFSCICGTGCVLRSEHALVHRPTYNCMPPHTTPNESTPAEVRYYELLGSVPWNWHGSRVQHHKVAADVAALLVKTCGKDVKTTTAAEMDALDRRFICDGCRADGPRPAMAWRAMILHLTRCIHGSRAAPKTITLLNEVDTARVKALEVDKITDGERVYDEFWICAHCPGTSMLQQGWIASHMSGRHQIDDPQEGRDYRLRPDCFARPIQFVPVPKPDDDVGA